MARAVESLGTQISEGKYENLFPNSFQEESWFIDHIGLKKDGDIYTPPKLRKYFMKIRELGVKLDEESTKRFLRRPVIEYRKNKRG